MPSGAFSCGTPECLWLDATDNDEGSACPAFVCLLVERGLTGVRLVISDDQRGLVRAVREQLLGPW